MSRGVTSSPVIFFMSYITLFGCCKPVICVSVLLPGPPSQGAPVLECRCCYCHTCSAHRPSYLPLPSISPGVQVLLFLFLSLSSSHSPALFFLLRLWLSLPCHLFTLLIFLLLSQFSLLSTYFSLPIYIFG